MADAGTDTTTAGSVISLPQGGGAVNGLGEKFRADLFTGTGNFSVPIAVPPGRGGLQPQLSVSFSTGNGNGAFGLGWGLSLPGISRKTSHGVPRYRDTGTPDGESADTFILSGAEDLVPVAGASAGRVRYRPRTEGLFARIEHVRDSTGDFWEVRGRDGMITRYGTRRPDGAPPDWRDPAVVEDPARPGRVFAWKITETADVFGNLIRYTYVRDRGHEAAHRWDQPLIGRIEYADYGDRRDPSFLVSVSFEYEPRPDAFSDYRAGFEIRTTLRCRAIRTTTHAADGVDRAVREYRFVYEQASFNGATLLTRLDVVGVDDTDGQPRFEALPPLTLGYSAFDPSRRRFRPVEGDGLPPGGLGDPAMAFVDLRGRGLSDIVELGTSPRYWSNRGNGQFDLPRSMPEAPPHRLGEPGVRLIDADGDGRSDLLVASGAQSGYFPMTFGGGWSRRSFQPYRQAPSVSVNDENVKLIDLDGDGLTDVVRSGSRLECFFNDADPRRAWQRTTITDGPVSGIDLANPTIRLGDMTGDGLIDIVQLRNGNVAYWPNLGHGRFGSPVQMRTAPRLPDGFDPRRLLLGDVDGDGAADLVYVDDGRVLLWGNRSGNGWTPEPVVITGTPAVVDTDSLQLADLYGAGMAGLLWIRPANGSGDSGARFLDFSGGHKSGLLDTLDNHLGARTTVQYRPSTEFFLRDDRDPATRWRTTLPFPVHVVARVDVVDEISSGTMTTEYRYHHGYWDGVEREFRGFAMVEQFDTETFVDPDSDAGIHYSPPTLTKSWFHLGPVAALEAGDWTELDLSDEYWSGDAQMLSRPAEMTALLAELPRRGRRDALRALRGQTLRTELYALDGSDRQGRPYTVTESLPGLREEDPRAPDDSREHLFFAFGIGQRATQWERGVDPMTTVSFTGEPDRYGSVTQQLTIAVPRHRDPLETRLAGSEPYLATYATTEFARRDDADHFMVTAVARTTSYEVLNRGSLSVPELRDAVLDDQPASSSVSLRVIAHGRAFYDGDAYVGLPLGQLGDYGLAVRSEMLVFEDGFLDDLFDPADPFAVGSRPPYLDPDVAPVWGPEYPAEFRASMPELAGYRHYAEGDVPGSPGGFYAVGARQRFDVHDHDHVPRGLLLTSRDPLDAETTIVYDEHDLLPRSTIDAIGLEMSAVYDLRLLQPRAVTDINGNTASATFSPAGLVTAHYVRGKNGEGDDILPSVRMEYDLSAFAERGQPASVRTISRVFHDTQTDIPADRRDDEIVSVEYSDGFGRALQTRGQAEDVLFGDPVFGGGVLPVDQTVPAPAAVGRVRTPGSPLNVVVSGWQVYDNKGRVVEKYEPFYSTGFDFTAPVDAELGRKATTFYDPRGHPVRTLNPDGSEQVVVYGIPVDLADPDVFAPSPWEAYTYDANDNAGRTHRATAEAYRDHWNTPASTEVDALGRTVVAVTRNGPDPDQDWFASRSLYDIQSHLVALTDALGREAFRYRYDLTGRRWRVDSIDAGRRDTILDALGGAVEGRDSKGAVTLAAFDVLRRPTRGWARDDTASPIALRQRLEYGDGGDSDQPDVERELARAHNLLGLAVAHYDEAGVATLSDVDVKGNPLVASRRVIADTPILAVYEQAAANGWHVTPFHVDWQPAVAQTFTERAAELLEANAYTTTTNFDALSRAIRQVLPADVEGRRQEVRPEYNRVGGLERMFVDDTAYVERIAYDAKGQRALVAYGNGVMTRHAYDPDTFRLRRPRSEHYTTDGVSYRPSGDALQDVGYEYDLVGNILTMRDRTYGSGIPKHQQAFNTGDPASGQLLMAGYALYRHFSYDPIYRLVAATGREIDRLVNQLPWEDQPRGTDVTRTAAYTERYNYDPTGSLLRLEHTGRGAFTRVFDADPASNRLQHLQVGQHGYDYTFDANGNVTSETTSRHFDWNHADQLTAFRTQTDGAEPSVHAHYLYDAAGQRVKKLVRKQGGQIEVTHYVSDLFEHHRWGPPSQLSENNHIHVVDDLQRIAIVRVGPAHPGDRAPAVQYHLADHLGSSTVVVDDTGAPVNREEFTPYGETSFGSYARKRYRYTGKERDEESGLAYHGARYLMPWTARWTTCDPIGEAGGINQYLYAAGNATLVSEQCGTEPTAQQPDADGNYWMPDETIVVHGRAPGSSLNAGTEDLRLAEGENPEGEAFWSSIPAGGRGRAGNLRYDALRPDQSIMRELMDKRWGCTICHVSTEVHNRYGRAGIAPENGLPLDWTLDPGGLRTFSVVSTIVRGTVETTLAAKALGEFISPGTSVLSAPAITATGSATGGRTALNGPPLRLTLDDHITAAVERRMRALGIPEENIGIKGYPGRQRGYDPAEPQPGRNGRGDPEYGVPGGITAGRGILEKSWSGGGRWRQWERARFSTRIDAVIAHEWLEFGGLTHLEAAAAGPMTPLPISRGARRLLATHPDIQR